MATIVSKVGIHNCGGVRTGYGAFLQTINAADRRLALVKCRDDFGAMDEALALWPNVLCIGAFTDFDGLPFDFSHFIYHATLNPKVKIWEVLNEINGDWTTQADLYISLAPEFAVRGWSLCMFNCASGTPPYPNEDGGIAYQQIERACRYMKDHGYTAYLGLHEYQASGGTIGRFKVLADYLEMRGALLPIVITEYGFETHPGDVPFMAMIRANDPLYMADGRVLGCATWTLGGGGWQGSNYQTALPDLGNYIATVAPVTPLPADEWEFDYWDVDGTRYTLNPIALLMDKDRVLTPHAKKKILTLMRTLTLKPCPEYSGLVVHIDPADMTYPDGTMVTCAAVL